MGTRPLPALAGCLLLVSEVVNSCGQGESAGTTSIPASTTTAPLPAGAERPLDLLVPGPDQSLTHDRREAAQAWLVPVNGSEVPAWEVPIAGVARFVTAPVTVRPVQLTLQGTGLGIVELGRPEASALPLLEARFRTPTSHRRRRFLRRQRLRGKPARAYDQTQRPTGSMTCSAITSRRRSIASMIFRVVTE